MTDDLVSWTYVQGWGHGPVYVVIPNGPDAPRDRMFTVRAVCYDPRCCSDPLDSWMGPDRTGDPHDLELARDDAIEHLHHEGAGCGMCVPCLSRRHPIKEES